MEARMGHPRRCNFVKSCVQLTAFIIAWFTCMSRVSGNTQRDKKFIYLFLLYIKRF